jgi:hypothetical protein
VSIGQFGPPRTDTPFNEVVLEEIIEDELDVWGSAKFAGPGPWFDPTHPSFAGGAPGDGVHSADPATTAAATAASTYVATHGGQACIMMPPPPVAYLLGASNGGNGPLAGINLSSVQVLGLGTKVRLDPAVGSNPGYCFRFDHGTIAAPDGDVLIDGFVFDGNERNMTYVGAPIYATENNNPTPSPVHVGIYSIWMNRLRITNCTFTDFAREAIWIPYGVAPGYEQYSRMDIDIDNCLFILTAKAITIESGRRVKINITVDTPLCSDKTYLDRIVTLNLESISEVTIDGRYHGGGRSGNLSVASGVAVGTTQLTCFPVGTDLPPGTVVWDNGMSLWLGYAQAGLQSVTLTAAVHAGDTVINVAAFTPSQNFAIGAALTPDGGRFNGSYECISQGGPVALGNCIVRGSYRGWYGQFAQTSGNVINVGNDTPATLGQQGATTLSGATGVAGGTVTITVNALPTAVKNRQQIYLVSAGTIQAVAVNNAGGYAAGTAGAITVSAFTPAINFPVGAYVLWGSSGEVLLDNVTIDDCTAFFGIKARGNVTIANPRVSRVGGPGIYLVGSFNRVIGGSVRACNTQQFAGAKRCGILLGNTAPDYCDQPSVVGTRVYDDGVQQNMYAIGTGLGSVTNAHLIGNDWSGCIGVDGNLFNANVCKQTGAEVRNNKGWNPVGNVTTPAFPATTVGQQNLTGHDVVAYILNGANSMTFVVTGVGLGNIAAPPAVPAGAWFTVIIPAGQTFTPTYAGGAPAWKWYGL